MTKAKSPEQMTDGQIRRELRRTRNSEPTKQLIARREALALEQWARVPEEDRFLAQDVLRAVVDSIKTKAQKRKGAA